MSSSLQRLRSANAGNDSGLPIKSMVKSVLGFISGNFWPFSNGVDDYDSFNKEALSPYYLEHSFLADQNHRTLVEYLFKSNTSETSSLAVGGATTVGEYGTSESSHEGYEHDEKGVVDYSILSIAVVSLGLLLIVEFMLHQLDHLAHRRKFFKIVTRTFYRECKLRNCTCLKDEEAYFSPTQLSILSGNIGYS